MLTAYLTGFQTLLEIMQTTMISLDPSETAGKVTASVENTITTTIGNSSVAEITTATTIGNMTVTTISTTLTSPKTPSTIWFTGTDNPTVFPSHLSRLVQDYHQQWDQMSLHHRFILLLTLIFLLAGGLLANLLVLASFHKQRLTRSPTNYLLLNLTVAHLLLTCWPLAMMFTAMWKGRWPLGDNVGCLLYSSSFLTFGAVCITTKVAIALERYLTISRHWNGMGQRRFALKCITVTWTLAILWGLTPMVISFTGQRWSAVGPLCLPQLDTNPIICLTFSTCFLCLFVVGPLITKSILYYLLYKNVTLASNRVRYSRNSLMNLAIRVSQASQCSNLSRKSSTLSNASIVTAVSNQVATLAQASPSPSGFPAQQRRLALAMTIMVFMATVTWLPYSLALLLHTLKLHAFHFSLWTCILCKTSVIHTPLMYVVCNKRFRATFISALFCQCKGPLRAVPIAPAPVPVNGTNTANNKPQRMNSFRGESRWRFSIPGLATIDETGSHVALPGSKQNDYDSGYAISSNASSGHQEHQLAAAGRWDGGSDSASSPGFTAINEATEPGDRLRQQIVVASQEIPKRPRKKKNIAPATGHAQDTKAETNELPPVQN